MPARRVILVVEDDAAVRRMLAMLVRGLLADLDIEVHEAVDGDAALRWVAELHPAVVLTDVMMPGRLDGAALAARLKADPATANIRVLALSGDPGALDRARAAGADAAFPKTTPPSDVVAVIRRWLADAERSGDSGSD